MSINVNKYKITKNNFDLKKFKTKDTGNYKDEEDAVEDMRENIEKLTSLQDRLYAENKNLIVLIIQAMDAAGKDGTVKHVLSGVNPQGVHIVSFKQPNSTELDHDYLWRINANLPERGMIGIFNRSHYEDVLVVRVHDIVKNGQLPERVLTKNIWNDRFRQITNFETYLYENGIKPIKIFLNVSKEEQKDRLLARIEEKDKNWKFNLGDVEERKYWDKYMECFQDAINNTSTEEAPWYIVPADNKWYARFLVSEILVKELEKINPKYPVLSKDALAQLEEGKNLLLNEGKKPTKTEKVETQNNTDEEINEDLSSKKIKQEDNKGKSEKKSKSKNKKK